MPGILVAQSRPSSPEEIAAYHEWYDEQHIPEILSIEGFVSARRLQALDGESFLTIYEIEGDVEQAKARLTAARESMPMTKPAGMELDPPPTAQYFCQLD